jgi:hypothetical protein
MRSPVFHWLAAAILCASPCQLFATITPSLAQGKEGEQEEIVRLTEWPKLSSKAAAQKDLEKVRKAGTEEMARQGQAALIAEGAGTVPMVLRSYERERNEEIAERVEELLIELTDATQTRLLAGEFKHKSERIREWTLLRVATFPDAGVRPQAEAALAAVRKKKDKASDSELYAAGLCVTSTGSLDGLPEVSATVLGRWSKHKLEIRSALEAVRGPEASALVLPRLEAKGRKERIAALRMLAGCGDETCVGTVGQFLDDTDNSIRIEAINALRGIVDGDPPMDKLSAFQAIEVANEWKGKL